MSQNHDDESRFIFKRTPDEKEYDVQDNEFPFSQYNSEEINSESTLNLNSNETLSKKKRNREKKNEESKPRNDNILKQVKVHSIEFITNTMNELMSDSINNFYKFNVVNCEQPENMKRIFVTFEVLIFDKSKEDNPEQF